MCKKLFVLALVLGLTGAALGYPECYYFLYDYDDLIIRYSMDSADSVDGYQLNSAWGWFSIGSAGDGNECFYSSDGVDYGPGILGDALYISNDGTGLPFDDPNSWSIVQPEMGDFIDIEEAAEELLAPFENVTVSMWFNQTAPLDINNHVSQWQSQTHATAHVFGTHWTYYGMIKVTQDVDNPGVAPDYLSFKLGGNVEGSGYFDTGPGEGAFRNKPVPIILGVWYHVAYSLGEEEPNGMVEACVYVNGVLLHSEMVNSFTTKQPARTDIPGLQVGAYHEVSFPDYFFMIPDGMLIDEVAIFRGVLSAAEIEDIYTCIAGEANYVTLTVNVEPNDIGIDTVTPDVGQHSCFENMPVIVDAEEFINCPDVYHFDHWEGDVADPNSAKTTVTMSADKTITAVFVDKRECGDVCHPILKLDLNEDCYINFIDFALYLDNWLSCTHPDCD
jgi:hypothetical protein